MTVPDRLLARNLSICLAVIFAGLAFAQDLFGPIQVGDTEAFHAALEAGADIHATDEYGQTPLMYAATFDRPDMAEALIAAGANVNAQTLAGWTALHYAARDATESRTLHALLDAGARPTARNHAGDTPHALATAIGNRSAADALQAAATPATLGTPHVTGTKPHAITPSETRQWIAIEGSGFAPGAVVTLAWGDTDFPIPAERTTYVSSSTIRVLAGIFPADSTWTARVTNPDATASNRHRLQFETPQATATVETEQLPSWPRLLGRPWTGPQAILDQPLCVRAGCRYLKAEPFDYQDKLYWTVHAFSMQEPPGVTLELVVGGAASAMPNPNRIRLVGVRISDTNRSPVRTASTLIEAIVWGESDQSVAVDAADICVNNPDIRDWAGTFTTRSIAGIQVTCLHSIADVLTGRRRPNPTFMFDLSLWD